LGAFATIAFITDTICINPSNQFDISPQYPVKYPVDIISYYAMVYKIDSGNSRFLSKSAALGMSFAMQSGVDTMKSWIKDYFANVVINFITHRGSL
jgi:hypothetical protein